MFEMVIAFTIDSSGRMDSLRLKVLASEKDYFMENRNDPEMKFIQIEDHEKEEFCIALDKVAFVSFKPIEEK